MKTTRRTAVFAALAMLAALFVTTPAAHGLPSGVSYAGATPTADGGATLWLARVAANNPLGPPTFHLKADLFFWNTSGTDREVDEVTISYPGTSITPHNYVPYSYSTDEDDNVVASKRVLSAGMQTAIPVYDGLQRDLPTPPPAQAQISVLVSGDSSPHVQTFDLQLRDNDVPLGSYLFPAKQSDLPAGHYWNYHTRHVVDAGGGGGDLNPSTGNQRYGYDLGVVRWTGSGWSGEKEGTDGSENEHSLVWDVPLYSMGDGTVVSCYKGEQDHARGGFDDITFDNNSGNTLVIQYGNESVRYAHFQHGHPTDDLCPGPEDTGISGLNIPVEAGQFLGRVGNTGRSTAPHLHLHEISTGTNGVPMQFHNVRALGDESNIDNLGGTPVLRPLHGMTLHPRSLISPNPCGLDDLPTPGGIEVARHRISAECYQDVFNQIVSRGYRPVFVDGYDVGGQTYFNAVFRSGGGTWLARHGLTGAQYQDVFDEATGDGLRLLNVDSYLVNGAVRYAVIFDDRPGAAWAAFHGLGDAAYADKVDELADAGLVPVNVSTVEIGGSTFWTGLFEAVTVNGWTIESVPTSNYQATFDANVAAGRIPLYVNGYNTGSGPFLTAVFVDPGSGTVAAHGLSFAGYQNQFEVHTGAGLLTRAVTGYDEGSGAFAAVWRVRPGTSLTATPSAQTNSTTASFGFTSTDPFATFECRLDGESWSPCTSTHGVSSLTEGTHTFEVRAVDREGVRDPSPASMSWLVDLTPPDVMVAQPVENTKVVHGSPVDDPVSTTTVVGWADVAATATDDLTGVASVVFTVNGTPVPAGDVTHDPSTDTWSFLFVPDQNGENVYTVGVTATDGVGNSAGDTLLITGTKTGKKPPAS